MRFIVLIATLLATPAYAQLSVPPAPVDLTPIQQAAAAAQVKADAAVAAALTACQPMALVPPAETIGGSAGTGSTCRLANAVQPRISRTVAFTTTSTGQAVLTWTDMGATPRIYVQEEVTAATIATAAANVPRCYPIAGTATATGVTIQCYVTQTLVGLGLVPFAKAAAGVTGSILALPTAQ